MFNINNPTTIIFPSDIKLKVRKITDSEGHDVPKNGIYIMFLFMDKYGADYKAVYDPSGKMSEHIVYNQVDDSLDIMIERYKMRGPIYVKVGTKSTDLEFSDGNWDWWTAPENTGITIKC